jgi:hypothetical protein
MIGLTLSDFDNATQPTHTTDWIVRRRKFIEKWRPETTNYERARGREMDSADLERSSCMKKKGGGGGMYLCGLN